jgi:hypothetical protein
LPPICKINNQWKNDSMLRLQNQEVLMHIFKSLYQQIKQNYDWNICYCFWNYHLKQ